MAIVQIRNDPYSPVLPRVKDFVPKPSIKKVVKKHEVDPTVLTESKMIAKLAGFFDQSRNRIFIRSTLLGWEMDVVIVTGSRILHEIEIKVSLPDWKNDCKKTKWNLSSQHKVGKFWYAVPGPLIEKKPDWVPDTAGLIAVGSHVTVIRPAKIVSKYRVSDSELVRLHDSSYFRWCLHALKTGNF